MKNVVYGIIIAACIILAAVVFKFTRPKGSGGIENTSNAKMVWIKCRSCGQAYEMGERDYYEALAEKSKTSATAMMFTPPLTCEKCGKNAAFIAEKCPNCGEIFFPGSIPNDMPDRCPKCKHSAIEDSRKARLNQRQQ
jgi:predicted Zn-ribbon and HTH transcriptional regulator